MKIIKKVHLFADGDSHAVRLPAAFRFRGTHMRITKIGDGVVLTPITQDRPDTMTDASAAFEFEPDFVLARPKPMPQTARDQHLEDVLFMGVFSQLNQD